MFRSLPVLLIAALPVFAEDWPQWLGPNRDGTSAAKVAAWKGDLKVVWRKPVGEGNSSPVVAGGMVFLHTKVAGKDAEAVQAFDAATGDTKWEKSYEKPAFNPAFGKGPRATPVVTQDRVYTFGNTGTLICWNSKTGEQVWRAETLKDPKKDNLFFGVSASPLVVGELLITQAGTGGSKGLMAFDLAKGGPIWTAGEDAASYAAPVKLGDDIVVLTGANLAAISPKGESVWKFPFKDALNESSTTPIKTGDLYIAGSVTAGSVALKVVVKDGKPAVETAWKNPKLTCYFSTPVAVTKDHFYVVTGMATIASPTVTLRCVETATGKEVWNQPKVGKYHAALLKMADGKLLMHGDDGTLSLLEPNVKEYQELCRAKICGDTWAHPAISNGKIYVRDGKELLCLSLGE